MSPNISSSIATGYEAGPDPFAMTLQKLDQIQKKKEKVDEEMRQGALDLSLFLRKLQAETQSKKDVEAEKIRLQGQPIDQSQGLLNTAGMGNGKIVNINDSEKVFVPESLEDRAKKLQIQKLEADLGIDKELSLKRAQNEAEAQKIKDETKRTADIKNGLIETKQQIANIDLLENIFDKAEGVGVLRGSGSILGATLTGGATNKNTQKYNDYVKAISAGMYRSLTGDKRLSDLDAAARARPLLPFITQDKSLGKEKFQLLRKAFNIRKKLLEEGKFSVDSDGNLITPLDSLIPDNKNSKIMVDANGNRAEVEIDDKGNPIKVIREL